MGKDSGKAHWRADDSASFVNPYNFVRLGNGVQRIRPADASGDLTGKISCRLIARTPIAMPDASVLTEDERNGTTHKGENRPVPFMRTLQADGGRRYVIPGSEIRGVIRSAFEAVDNGCMSVNNSNVASARHPFPRNPGVLSFDSGSGKWTLFKAKMRSKRDSTKLGPEDRVRTWRHAPNNGGKTVLRKLDEIVEAVNLESAVEDYFISLEMYCDGDSEFKQYRENTSSRGDDLWSTVKRADGDWPVFYEIVDDTASGGLMVYLSPAQISRSVFMNRVNDLLGGDSPTSYKKCSDIEFACEPCILFGFIGDKGAVASKLRFTDAVIGEDSADTAFASVTLKELSGPKTSSVEFYTERPEGALTWTYDYMTTGFTSEVDARGRTRIDPEREILEKDRKVRIRGRKFYLHHYAEGGNAAVDKAILKRASTQERTIRNMTTCVAPTGSVFSFDVFYSGITQEQLDKLLWVLCIGDNNEASSHLHKIGHGKPLGLGSVKIVVDSIVSRSGGPDYHVEVSDDCVIKSVDELFGSTNDAIRDYLVITDFELAKGLDVRYPVADAEPYAGSRRSPNAQSSHQWFIANRSYGPESRNQFKQDIAYTLPVLPASKDGRSALLLPKFVKDGDKRAHAHIDRPQKRHVASAPKEEGERPLTAFELAMKRAQEKEDKKKSKKR